jgi:hypothetical protein
MVVPVARVSGGVQLALQVGDGAVEVAPVGGREDSSIELPA